MRVESDIKSELLFISDDTEVSYRTLFLSILPICSSQCIFRFSDYLIGIFGTEVAESPFIKELSFLIAILIAVAVFVTYEHKNLKSNSTKDYNWAILSAAHTYFLLLAIFLFFFTNLDAFSPNVLKLIYFLIATSGRTFGIILFCLYTSLLYDLIPTNKLLVAFTIAATLKYLLNAIEFSLINYKCSRTLICVVEYLFFLVGTFFGYIFYEVPIGEEIMLGPLKRFLKREFTPRLEIFAIAFVCAAFYSVSIDIYSKDIAKFNKKIIPKTPGDLENSLLNPLVHADCHYALLMGAIYTFLITNCLKIRLMAFTYTTMTFFMLFVMLFYDDENNNNSLILLSGFGFPDVILIPLVSVYGHHERLTLCYSISMLYTYIFSIIIRSIASIFDQKFYYIFYLVIFSFILISGSILCSTKKLKFD